MVFVYPCKDDETRQAITDLVFAKYDIVQNIAFMD